MNMNGPHRLFLRQSGKIASAIAGGSAAVLLGRSVRSDEELPVRQYRHFLEGHLAHCEGEGPVEEPTTGTIDDKPPPPQPQANDDFPNFTRHGSKATLPKLLTPQMYQQLKDLQTPKFGVTLDDMIRAATMLPYGADPPRGVGGVYTGDADCYRVFAPLLVPLVEEYHGVTLEGSRYSHKDTLGSARAAFARASQLNKKHSKNDNSNSNEKENNNNNSKLKKHQTRNEKRLRYYKSRQKSRLKRHQTNLDPEQIVTTQLDPTGEYILYTRMRLARNLEGFAFCSHQSRSDRRKIQRLFQQIVNQDFRPHQGGAYIPLHAMSNLQHDDFMSRRICFMDPDEFKIAANLARDWPDARGIYGCRQWDPTKSRNYNNVRRRRRPSNTTTSNSSLFVTTPVDQEIELWEDDPPNIVIWNNYDDHFWIISVNKGGDVQGVFTALSDAVRQLELSLLDRGYSFCVDPKLGFLTSSPSNVGTALRASMSVKLVRLGKQHPVLFQEILDRLHLEAKSDYAETDQRYTGIFDIANAERLGRTEVQWINVMIQGVAKLIELEKKLERGEPVSLQDVDDVVKNVDTSSTSSSRQQQQREK